MTQPLPSLFQSGFDHGRHVHSDSFQQSSMPKPAHWIWRAIAAFSVSEKFERLRVLGDFVSRSSSPVNHAAVKGRSLLSDNSEWLAARAYHSGPTSDLYLKIWKAVLPTLCIMQLRVMGMTRGWPLRLIEVLSESNDIASKAESNFDEVRPCCLPGGLRSLHKYRKSPMCKHLVSEFLVQIDTRASALSAFVVPTPQQILSTDSRGWGVWGVTVSVPSTWKAFPGA